MSIELASVCIIQKVLCLVDRSRASSNCLLLNKQTTIGRFKHFLWYFFIIKFYIKLASNSIKAS
jgi:hypothetical protein